MSYIPNSDRYKNMLYNRCGRSGLMLPAFSLGLWHNFGSRDNYDNMAAMAKTAFDLGITHFDLANNYGPYPGSAEENFGRILKREFDGFRDELIISTKAGYDMWEGPYGNWGSKKYLVASLDQSLKRMGLDYVDIFYHHRPDPNTPIEETAAALDLLVRQGKALYVGISNYSPEQTQKMAAAMRSLGTPLLIHQMRYNMFERKPEAGLFDTLEYEGMGSIAFCPLAQGLLTNKYLHGIPADSRATKSVFLTPDRIQSEEINKSAKLNEMAEGRGQSLAQMACAWNLRRGRLTSVILGASRPSQIEENVKALDNFDFTDDELAEIDKILAE